MNQPTTTTRVRHHNRIRHNPLQQIILKSRSILKRAVRAKDREALDALIIDIEHTMHLAAGNLSELLQGTAANSSILARFFSKATETLTMAETEYEKLVAKTG